MVKRRFPDRSPVDTVTERVEELVTTKAIGSREQNVLGIDNCDEDLLFVLGGLLRDRSIDQIKREYFKECEYSDKVGRKLDELAHSLRNSMLFKPILFQVPRVGQRRTRVHVVTSHKPGKGLAKAGFKTRPSSDLRV